MNVVFAHDHKLRYIDGQYYTLGGLSDKVTTRYTSIFGDLTIICRAIEKQKYDNNIIKISNPLVKICAVHHDSLILTQADRAKIEKIVLGCDAVIIRIPSFIGNIVYKYAKQYNKTILSEVVTCPWDSYWNHGFKGKVVAPYMWWKTKQLTKGSDFVVYVTQEFLQRRYPTHRKQIGCSDVELTKIEESILKERCSKIKSRKADDVLVLGTLAALDTSFKGQQYVIRAIAILKKRGFLLKYRLAGGGSSDFLLKEAQKYGVEEQLIIDGVIPHDHVFQWIDSLDLYVQPSLQEGLPRALIEAMSRACPAIGSTAGGIPELLGERYLFRKKDVKGIINLIENSTNDFLMMGAKENYTKSLKYDKNVLDAQRELFYVEFKNYVIMNIKP